MRLDPDAIEFAVMARDAADVGDRRTYDAARRALETCACSVGDDDLEPRNANALRIGLDALSSQVETFRWPPRVVQAADAESRPDIARERLRSARVMTQENMRQLLGAARAALSSGDVARADRSYQLALVRWGRFNGQSRRIGTEAARATRGWTDRLDDSLRETQRDIENALTPEPSTAWKILGGLALALYLMR